MTTTPLLNVSGLKKYFPIYAGVFRHEVGQVKAVDGIDFTLYEGQVLGMVGESGSGKSTAGRAAIRLIEPTEGQVRFEGQDLLAFSSQDLFNFRRQVQIIFQDPYASLNPRKTIGDNIGEVLLYHKVVANESEMIDRVVDILHLIGLSPDAVQRYPHQFSGGQQQRICIGRAIAMKPKLIVCDEAVSALDISVQAQILNLLAELKEKMGLSYLFISHDLSVVRYLCDHVVVMHQGKIVESGTVDEIFDDPKDAYTKELLKAIPIEHPSQKSVQKNH